MSSVEKIAKILRTDKDVINDLGKKAGVLTGKDGIFDKISGENEELIKNRLQIKEQNIKAEEIYGALLEKIRYDDLQLFKSLGKPSFMLKEDVDAVLNKIKELVPPGKGEGFFLKKEKAIELLKNEPPSKVIDYLGYKNVDELIGREDVFEIFAAIRLFEDPEWLNEVFAKQYVGLKPDDFENRDFKICSLNQKWVGIAQSFLKKKYQNISHLKELGFIFVAPVELGIIGETTRMFSLALHYFHEVDFYSDLFRKFAENPETFGGNVSSLIKVEVFDKKLPETDKLRFLILPRYLAKYDLNDWRLAEPHISSESWFWVKAERSLRNINKLLNGVSVDFEFWQNIDWVGDYFKTSTGIDVLVSFDLVDSIMALIREKELEKYLYHHQESLWNKIFIEYFGEDALEKILKENLIKGYVEL